MDYLKIGETANRLSSISAPVIFIISGIGVSFDYYIPNFVPSKLLGGMFWVISLSVIGMACILVKHTKDPHHVVGDKCRVCQKPLLHTGEKCSNPDCVYEVNF